MPGAIHVRTGVVDDAVELCAIYAHHVRHGVASFEIDPPDAPEMARRLSYVTGQCRLPFVIAEQAGRVQGYAYASPYRTRPAYRYTVENSVYVAHDASGQGIGTTLLGELIRRCQELPVREMIAVIGDSANLASIRLHAHHGFAVVGTLRDVGWKHGRWIDSVLMQRTIEIAEQCEAGRSGIPP